MTQTSRWPLSAFHDLRHRPPGQLFSLDALRTLAVLLVIFGHAAAEHVKESGADNWFSRLPFVRGGFIGVDLFFVLSGYFIGRQLWRELSRTRSVHIGTFMLRRGFRIWPLYFFFLFFVLAVLRRGGFPYGSWWSDPIFLTNYINKGVVMGSWSLCTEEQFYIVTPLALYIGGRLGAKLSSFRPILVGLLVGLPVLRALVWIHYAGSLGHHDTAIFHEHIYFQFHTHSDGLFMGLLIANVEVDTGDAHKRGLLSNGVVVPVTLVLSLVMQRIQHEVLDFTAVTLLFGAMTWYLLCRGTRTLDARSPLRLLDSKVFYLLSRLSFGMYLNHEYLLAPLLHAMQGVPALAHLPPALFTIAHGTFVALVSTCISLVTFTIVEHPFLTLRGRVLGHAH